MHIFAKSKNSIICLPLKFHINPKFSIMENILKRIYRIIWTFFLEIKITHILISLLPLLLEQVNCSCNIILTQEGQN